MRAQDVAHMPDVPQERLSIVTIVGDGMKRRPGVAADIFDRLRHVNIVCISQGVTERSISIAIHESDLPAALDSIMRKSV